MKTFSFSIWLTLYYFQINMEFYSLVCRSSLSVLNVPLFQKQGLNSLMAMMSQGNSNTGPECLLFMFAVLSWMQDKSRRTSPSTVQRHHIIIEQEDFFMSHVRLTSFTGLQNKLSLLFVIHIQMTKYQISSVSWLFEYEHQWILISSPEGFFFSTLLRCFRLLLATFQWEMYFWELTFLVRLETWNLYLVPPYKHIDSCVNLESLLCQKEILYQNVYLWQEENTHTHKLKRGHNFHVFKFIIVTLLWNKYLTSFCGLDHPLVFWWSG